MVIDIETLLARGAAYKTLNPGEILFKEGEKGNFYYQLVSGRIRWVNITEEETEFVQNIIEEGESFGEIPLFDDEPFPATAIADMKSVIIRLDKASFLQLLAERPDLHFNLTKILVDRLRLKFLLIKEVARHKPENSILVLLAYLKKNKKSINPQNNRLNLTRQQIANMTGLRVETVIRATKKLEERNILEIKKGKIYIKNEITEVI